MNTLLPRLYRASACVGNSNGACIQWLRHVSVDVHKANSLEGNSKRRRQEAKRKEKRDSGRASYRFVDRTRVQVSGGMGGKGSLSMFNIGRKRKRRPDGGHGGNGGSIIIVADPKEQSLRWTNPHIVADAGKHGSSQKKHGKNGRNKVLKVPCGVVVRRVLNYDEEWDENSKTVRKLFQESEESEDEETDGPHSESLLSHNNAFKGASVISSNPGHRQPYLASLDYDSDEDTDEEDIGDDTGDLAYFDSSQEDFEPSFIPWGEREKVTLADLDQPGAHIVVARGGRGGTGSSIFASHNGPLPSAEILSQYAEPNAGDTAFLELELKLIADIGLVGFPNAGKSSLLAAMSRATPHIAPYPFTTLNPLVGYIEYRDGFRVCAADIPGLIAGASMGKGKGHDFLRHLERTKALLYIVDAAGVDGRDPVEDLQILVNELGAYGDGAMLERNALVIANKMDLLSEDIQEEIMMDLRNVAESAGIMMSTDVLGISAGVTGEGLAGLSEAIRSVVKLTNDSQDQNFKAQTG